MSSQDAAEKGIDDEPVKKADSTPDGAVQKPLQGWRLVGVLTRYSKYPIRNHTNWEHWLTLLSSLGLGLLLATIETSITATALVTIGDYFKDSVTVSLQSLRIGLPLISLAGNMGCSGLSPLIHGCAFLQAIMDARYVN